jgi:hypothetical protein
MDRPLFLYLCGSCHGHFLQSSGSRITVSWRKVKSRRQGLVFYFELGLGRSGYLCRGCMLQRMVPVPTIIAVPLCESTRKWYLSLRLWMATTRRFGHFSINGWQVLCYLGIHWGGRGSAGTFVSNRICHVAGGLYWCMVAPYDCYPTTINT